VIVEVDQQVRARGHRAPLLRRYDPGMKEIWKRIGRWLAANAPEALEALRPPAAAAELLADQHTFELSHRPEGFSRPHGFCSSA
jgi:hypothetical protein